MAWRSLTLEGCLVRLEPLTDAHVDALMAISTAHPEVYRFTSTPVDALQAEQYFATAFRGREQGSALPFAVIERASGEVVGSTRLTELHWHDRNCELGYTWYDPRLFGTGVNAECKYLMLSAAFEYLELIRVQIHTDTRNEASQRAIRSLGARYEGVLRRHKIAKDGYVRDTMVFAITDLDWPDAKERIEGRLRRRGVEPVPLARALQR